MNFHVSSIMVGKHLFRAGNWNTYCLVLLVCSGLFALSGCEQEEPPTPQANSIVPGPVVNMSSYPLQVGNQWIYSMQTVITGSINSNEQYVVDFSVVSDTSINGVPCKKVKSTETVGTVAGNDRLGYRFLAHTNLGLDMLAYDGQNPQIFFKEDHLAEISELSFLTGAVAATDSVVVLDTTIHYMRFPAVDGEIWGSNEFGGIESGARFKRKWSGYYTVTTGAGTFDCIRLELFSDYDGDSIPNDLYLEQYISPQYGLIKEVSERWLTSIGQDSSFFTREAELTSKNF